jgi:hypothetical protein
MMLLLLNRQAQCVRRDKTVIPIPRIRWLDDQLPELSHTGQLGISFDIVLLSAVWQHVSPTQRERAIR